MTTEAVWNTTNSAMTMDSSGTLSIMLILMVGSLTIGVLLLAISNLERYKRIWAILTKMGTSVVCFAYGLCVVVPLVGIYFLLTWIIDLTKTYHLDPIWLVYIAGGYAGISAIGWFVKNTIGRIKILHKEMKEET